MIGSFFANRAISRIALSMTMVAPSVEQIKSLKSYTTRHKYMHNAEILWRSQFRSAFIYLPKPVRWYRFLRIFVLILHRVHKSSNFEYRAPISRLDYSKAEVSDGREIFPLTAILFRNFWNKTERQKILQSKCFWGIITFSNVRDFHV